MFGAWGSLVNLFVRSNSQPIKDLNDECFNGKEKDGFGIWEAVIKRILVF